jgi:hypothetical protein
MSARVDARRRAGTGGIAAQARAARGPHRSFAAAAGGVRGADTGTERSGSRLAPGFDRRRAGR